MSLSSVLTRLRAGQPTQIINVNYPAPRLAAKLVGCGFSGIFIDCEHGAYSIDQVEAIGAAVLTAGGLPIVRPEGHAPWLLQRYINIGVRGLCLPHLHNGAEARSLAAAIADTEAGARGDVLAMGIIESRQGVDNLAEICAVSGIDALMVGPVDLARSLGYEPVRDRDAIADLVDSIIATIRSHGLAAGTRCTRDTQDRLARAGCTVFYRHANDLLEHGAQDILPAG